MYSINFIGCFFCSFLLSFFSVHSTAFPAASSHFDTVQKIYIGYYQRAADPVGLIYWAGRLDSSGGNLTEIIEAFANSAESQALYGTINSGNISTVVNEIYNALFARDAEAGGRDYYVAGFNEGRFTAATIMLNVLDGAVGGVDLQSVNNKLAAANLFTREIDPELDGSNFQVTYAGDVDAIAGRNFLSLYATSVIVPTQAETTAYIRNNIADLGDPILGQASSSPPNFVRNSSDIISVYHYSNGVLSGMTCHFRVRNIGGSGVINVTVTAGEYTENRQFNVSSDTQYDLMSFIPIKKVGGTSSLNISALFQGAPELIVPLTFSAMIETDYFWPYLTHYYTRVATGTPSSVLDVDQ